MSGGDPSLVAQDTEAAWQRLRKHVEWLTGGWIGFLTVGSPASAETLRMRLTWQLRRQGLPLEHLAPETPQALEQLLPRIESAAPGAGCVWVEALRTDQVDDESWTVAWQHLLRALNHRRDTVRTALDRGGLLLVGPNGFTQIAQRWAPDLWSVRSVVVQAFDARDLPALRHGDTDPLRAGQHGPSTRDTIPEHLRGPEARRLLERVTAGRRATEEGRHGVARQLAQEALSIARDLQDPEVTAMVLIRYADALVADDDRAGALAAIEEARASADASMPIWPDVLDRAYTLAAINSDWERASEIAGQALAVDLDDLDELASLGFRSAWLDQAGISAANLGRWDEAERAFSDALALDRRLVAEQPDPAILHGIVKGLKRVMEVALVRGAWSRASELAEEELAIARTIGQAGTPEARAVVASALLDVGQVRRHLGDLVGAEQVYVEALALNRDRVAASEDVEDQRALARTLRGLGDIYETGGDQEAAERALREALEIDERLNETRGDVRSMRALAHDLNALGEAEVQRRDWSAAGIAHERALALRRTLAEINDTPEERRNLAVSLAQVGDVAMMLGDLVTAEERYLEALEIHRAIAAAQDTPQSQHDLAVSLSRISTLAGRRGDLRRARDASLQTLEINRRLAEAVGTPSFRHDLAVTLWHVGALAQQMGDPGLARDSYGEALEICRELAAASATPQSLTDVAVSLDYLGSLAQEEGDWDTADSTFREALGIRRAIDARLGTAEARRAVSIVLGALGDIAFERGDLPSAAGCYEESLAIDRELDAVAQTAESKRDVSVTLVRVGDVALERDDLDAAHQAYVEALEIDRALHRLDAPNAHLDLAADLSRLVSVALARPDYTTAEALLREALDLLQPHSARPDAPVEVARALAPLLELQGAIAEQRNDHEAARTAYAAALRELERLGSDEPDFQELEAHVRGRLAALP